MWRLSVWARSLLPDQHLAWLIEIAAPRPSPLCGPVTRPTSSHLFSPLSTLSFAFLPRTLALTQHSHIHTHAHVHTYPNPRCFSGARTRLLLRSVRRTTYDDWHTHTAPDPYGLDPTHPTHTAAMHTAHIAPMTTLALLPPSQPMLMRPPRSLASPAPSLPHSLPSTLPVHSSSRPLRSHFFSLLRHSSFYTNNTYDRSPTSPTYRALS